MNNIETQKEKQQNRENVHFILRNKRRCTHQRRKSTKIRVLSQLNLRNWLDRSLGQTFPCLEAFAAGQATTYKIGLDLGNSSIKALGPQERERAL
ncbi:hypothetical protein P8452_08449 [Trifolium repens]|nr:hypothetical protein P8452_08449 [Trifolium repens]